MTIRCLLGAAFATALVLGAGEATAQERPSLDSLVARALEVNPRIRAARDRVEAMRTRIAPAGARPDPMLMAGIANWPLGRQRGAEPGADPMTMRTIGIGQTIPFPGKLPLQRQAAEHEHAAAGAMLVFAQREVEREVKQAWYEIAFLDQALDILQRNQQVLVNLIEVTESRYAVGTGGQQDVLEAQVETSRLASAAVELAEQRRAALARLNALLDRASEMPLVEARVPERIARAATASDAHEIRFVSTALGARAAGSPLPPLPDLQEDAIRSNPDIVSHEAEIRAQAARVELARKAHLPDFDVSLAYGQRSGRRDMISASVSAPIPWHKGGKQDRLVAAAEAELSALQADHHDKVNSVRARVAELYTELERVRAQLALYVKAIIPQGQATLTSATASFQVGRGDFATLLENQITVYSYENAYYRGLSDFAAKLAALEAVVGKEILP
jgi:outer membrane protein TolC